MGRFADGMAVHAVWQVPRGGCGKCDNCIARERLPAHRDFAPAAVLLLWAIDTCLKDPRERTMCNCKMSHQFGMWRFGVKNGNGGKEGGGIHQALGNPRTKSTTKLQAAFAQLCTIRYAGGDTRLKWSHDRIVTLLPQLAFAREPLVVRHTYIYSVPQTHTR
jgi:hypothetical protein